MSSHLSRKLSRKTTSTNEAVKKVSRKTTSTNEAVKKVSRNKAKTQEQKLDRSTNCREAIEGPGTFSIDPPSC